MRAFTESVATEAPPAFEVDRPDSQTAPYIFASPHSGDYYDPKFVSSTNLDPLTLRRSEDSFVDRIFSCATKHGAPLLNTRHPRVFVDVNREPFELDPSMFDSDLPEYVNTNSPRVAVGLGTIPSIVASGAKIYQRKLTFAEARARIDNYYVPYHSALKNLVKATRKRFGAAVVIDCHSMPSAVGAAYSESERGRPDFILGDRYGVSCHGLIIDCAEQYLTDLGYTVVRNDPYAGGFVTQHYGRPGNGIHALQIEINRAIYMDEALFQPSSNMTRLMGHIDGLVGNLVRIDPARIAAVSSAGRAVQA
jgi:N-formylglutamate amidohydrolase